MTNAINPDYYKDGWSNGVEIIDITEHLSFNLGNAVKYVSRAGKKDPDTFFQDLEKAKWYIDRELARMSVVRPFTLRKPEPDGPTIGGLREYSFEDSGFFAEHMAQPIVPRVWDSLDEAPKDIKVRGAGGEIWKWYDSAKHPEYALDGDGEWRWDRDTKTTTGIGQMNQGGPYTEIVPE
jgi:hypothetical protein